MLSCLGTNVGVGFAMWQTPPFASGHESPALTLEDPVVTATPSMPAETDKVSPDLHAVLELSLPGGTKRYAGVSLPVNSEAFGAYEGKVVTWSDVEHSMGDSNGALIPVTTFVEIEDTEPGHPLDAILYGSNGGAVRGSPFSISVVTSGGSSIPRFAGRIANVQGAGQFRWRFDLRSNDEAFQGRTLPVGQITQQTFPAVGDSKAWGMPMPLPFGIFDSRDGTLPGIGPTGSLPAYFVENVSNYWLAAGLDAFNIKRVFVNSTVKPNATWERLTLTMPGFQAGVLVPPFGGERVTVIHFLSSVPTVSDKVTWDGIGAIRGGVSGKAGGGSAWMPLTNPVDILRCVMNNYALPALQYRNGFYASADHELVDTASWDEARTWLERRAVRGALWLGDDFIDALTIINDFAGSFGIRLSWTLDGKIALKPRDVTKMVVYYDSPWLRAHESDNNPITPERHQGEIETSLAAESFQVPAQGKARNTIVVGDYTKETVSKYITSRVGALSRSGTRRRWAPGSARFLRGLLDSNPTGCYFADNPYTDLDNDIRDGVALPYWSSIKDFGSNFNLSQGNASQRPLLKMGAVAGKPSLLFDGVDDFYAGTSWTNLILATGFHIVVAVKVTKPGANLGAQNNPGIIGDSSGNVGMSVRLDSAGQNWIDCFVNEASLKTVSVSVNLGQWYIITMAKAYGVLFAAKNLFGDASNGVVCGDVASLAGVLRVGLNFPGAATDIFGGEIYCVIIQNDPDPSKQGSTQGYFSGGGFYYVAQHLADELRIPETRWA